MIAAASEFHALDLSRNTNPHVGFAAGIHYCLGAPLARMEIAVALTRLPARASGIEMLRPPERRASFQLRAHRHVYLRLRRT